jgi:transcriptional regulator with XRE-family HTH domain
MQVLFTHLSTKGGNHLYNNFEKIIKEKGVTPYRVAKDTGIATGTMSDWKLGKSTPKLDKIIKISNYLGVPLEDLIKNDIKVE